MTPATRRKHARQRAEVRQARPWRDNSAHADPLRKPVKVCRECGSLPWRVEGEKCSACGLSAARETAVYLDPYAGLGAEPWVGVAEGGGW